MPYSITTDPTCEPVSTTEAKEFLRYDSDAANATIDQLVKAARRLVEQWEWRALITQTITLKLDAFPSDPDDVIHLPRPPLQSVTSIKYVDSDGVTQTIDSANYDVDTTSEPGRVKPSYGNVWPTPRVQNNAVEVIYVAGYGDDGKSVPEDTRLAIRMLVAHFWRNREAVSEYNLKEVPLGMEALLRPVNNERVLTFS